MSLCCRVSFSNVQVYFPVSAGFADGDMCCIFTQIRPSDGGYGFTLEEKNRVPIIKSVEKGSPAEVGMCIHTHAHRGNAADWAERDIATQ